MKISGSAHVSFAKNEYNSTAILLFVDSRSEVVVKCVGSCPLELREINFYAPNFFQLRKKFKGHIGLGLSVQCSAVSLSVCL